MYIKLTNFRFGICNLYGRESTSESKCKNISDFTDDKHVRKLNVNFGSQSFLWSSFHYVIYIFLSSKLKTHTCKNQISFSYN